MSVYTGINTQKKSLITCFSVGKSLLYRQTIGLMMGNTNINLVQMSDVSIVKQIGGYIKHIRLEQNKTQVELAKMAGLNRWTISQIENGESITLMSLIQILRALDCLYVLNTFEVVDEISPLEYAKLKKKKKERARSNQKNTTTKKDLEW